jgi:hypothetical protein
VHQLKLVRALKLRLSALDRHAFDATTRAEDLLLAEDAEVRLVRRERQQNKVCVEPVQAVPSVGVVTAQDAPRPHGMRACVSI